MLEWVNAAACFVLICLTVPIARVMNPDGHWPQRLTLLFVLVLLALQVVQPVSRDWVADPSRIQMLFNVVLMVIVLSARREIMALVRLSVGKPADETPHVYRRASDITAAQMSQIQGGKK